MLVFVTGGKLEYQETLWAWREPATNPHIYGTVRESNPGHISWRRVIERSIHCAIPAQWLMTKQYTHLHVYISVNKSHCSLPRYDVSQCFRVVVVVPVAIWRIVWRWYTAGHVDKLASYRYHIWILFHGVSHPDEVLSLKFIEYPTKKRTTRREIQDASIKTNGSLIVL